MQKKKYTNTEIIADLRRVYKENHNKPFTRRIYEAKGDISKTTVENRFGSWNDALKKAGLYTIFAKAKKATTTTNTRKSKKKT
jgi:hypothetical protein